MPWVGFSVGISFSGNPLLLTYNYLIRDNGFRQYRNVGRSSTFLIMIWGFVTVGRPNDEGVNGGNC